MTTINSSTTQSFIDRTTRTIENELEMVGDAVAGTLTTGVKAAADVVVGTAVVGVKVIGALVDTWV